MNSYNILVPDIGSELFYVSAKKIKNKFYNVDIKKIVVTNWEYNYKFGLTVCGCTEGEYGTVSVKGSFIFENYNKAKEFCDSLK